jgi:putative aldouronate transport system substrate-binding protein
MKKLLCVLLLLAALASLNACGGGKETANEVEFEVTTNGIYPIQTDKTVTYWAQRHESVAANFGSLNETVFGQELIQQTGINVEFIHPPAAQAGEKFNLLIASRDLPDIIEWNWYNFTGGPHMAIEDGVILPLNSVVEKAAPNLKAYLDAHDGIAKDIMTDEGELYIFPMIKESDYLTTSFGPMFRKDLLDKAGLTVPETVAEWEQALYAFKDMGVETPLMLTFDNNRLKQTSAFLGAFGVMGDFWHEDGKVKFGPYDEAAFSAFVELIAKWYKDGLLDKNFMDTSPNRYTALGLSGTWGAAFGSAGGNFGSWIPAITKNVPEAEFAPAKYPVMNKGELPRFGAKSFLAPPTGGNAAITTQCKDIEIAARLLDYAYSDAGRLLYNFGKEGESFDIIDGVPTYKEIITNSDVNSGQPMSYMIAKYARASYFGPMIQAEHYMRQYARLDVQKQAVESWANNRQTEYALGNITMSAEENREFSAIMADINTYRQEKIYKLITGTEGLDRLPEYFATLKSMGIERAIEITQAAYERYLKR